MKNKWNPLLASGLALTGAVALLAACGKTGTPPPPAPKVEASAPPPVAAVEPAPAPQAPAQAEVVDDATLTTRVKTALLGDPATQALAINVDSRDGVVQLSGFVDSQAQTAKAAEVAQAVPGVRSVDNKLDMRTGGTQAPAGKVSAVDDSTITNHIKEALLGDPYMNNIDVAVVTRNGEVQVSGFVPNQDQADDVLAAAHKVEGVKNVVSTLSIGGPAAGSPPEQPPPANQPADQPANQPAAGQ